MGYTRKQNVLRVHKNGTWDIWKVTEIYRIQINNIIIYCKGLPVLGVDPAFAIAVDGTKEISNKNYKVSNVFIIFMIADKIL